MHEMKFKNDKGEIDQEVIDAIQAQMKATSKKPEKIPRRLYHATPQKNLSSILENGIKPHEVFGEIHLCEKERQCAKFIPSPAIIFCIETKDLDADLIFISGDHKKIRTRNFESYTYYGAISPEFCKSWRRI